MDGHVRRLHEAEALHKDPIFTKSYIDFEGIIAGKIDEKEKQP